MKQNPPNARFWTDHKGGWVKVTIKPDAELRFFTHQRDEEGYGGTSTVLSHRGDHVYRWYNWYGRDCDGYVSSTHEDICLLTRLNAVEKCANWEDIFKHERGEDAPILGEVVPMIGTPDWKPINEGAPSVYDETAQSMNY